MLPLEIPRPVVAMELRWISSYFNKLPNLFNGIVLDVPDLLFMYDSNLVLGEPWECYCCSIVILKDFWTSTPSSPVWGSAERFYPCLEVGCILQNIRAWKPQDQWVVESYNSISHPAFLSVVFRPLNTWKQASIVRVSHNYYVTAINFCIYPHRHTEVSQLL